MSIFLASAGSFNVKNDNFHTFFSMSWLQMLNLPAFAPKQKYTDWTVSMEMVGTAKS